MSSSSAVVVDLPGADAVYAGLALVDRGFRPVPLFNGTSGPSAAIDVSIVATALAAGVERLKTALAAATRAAGIPAAAWPR